MPTIQTRVGELRAASAGTPDVRGGAYAELMVSELMGRYFELARFGRLFHTMAKTVTVAATHNTPIAAATATPLVAIHNPIGNTRAAVLVRAGVGTVSGTPAGGQSVLNVMQTTTAPTTPGGSIFNALSSASASPQGSTMRSFNNVALTGMLPVIGNEVAVLGQATAITAAGSQGPGVVGEDLGGMFIVAPGFLAAVMCGTGAGSSWIVNGTLSWYEIDWPL